ncbi:MAG TPA: cyclase family protein [Candidatus Saccharimonadia bacterium]|jgi:kynurenine formamidase
MYIDLTHRLTPDTPVYPGDPKPRVTLANSVDNDGFTDHLFTLGTHVGTHIDAPAHMISGGHTLDHYGLDRLISRGIVVNATAGFQLSTLKKNDIEPGDIVVFRTDLSQQFHKPEYFTDSPAIPEDIALYLVDKHVSMVGVDMGTIDRPPFTIHKILLGANILIIENLTNLHQLPETFTIMALPLKLALDGSPCRVIASTER